MTQTARSPIPDRPLVVMDARALAAATGARGVGAYVRGLVVGLHALGEHAPRLRLLATPGDPRALALDPGAIPFAHPPGPDVLWSHLTGPATLRRSQAALYHATFLAPLRAPRGVPTVATIHDLIPLVHPRAFTWAQRVVFGLSLRRSARACCVVAVSAFTADLVHRRLGTPRARIRVVAPPVEAADAATNGEREARAAGPLRELPSRYLLHMSGFDPQKGVSDLLLPAFASMSPHDASLKLVLTGPGSPWRDKAQSTARGLGLDGRVIFAGLLDEASRARALAHAAALVVSSRDEGFGIPAIEGLAFGLPVVVGPAEATRAAVGEAGFLAPDATPEGLARALTEALSAPSATEPEAEARRAHAGAYAPTAIARRLVAIYEEVLR